MRKKGAIVAHRLKCINYGSEVMSAQDSKQRRMGDGESWKGDEHCSFLPF